DPEKESNQAAAATPSRNESDLGDKDTGPRQVKLNSYPHESFGTQKRAFQHCWFEKYNWVEYSVRRNAAFCFPCRVFGKNIKFDSFVNNGCKNWKKAVFIFGKHEMAQTHRDSVVAWQSYQATSNHGNIAQILTSAHASDIAERREYLRRIVAVTSMLGRQGLSFRANDESSESTNRENFLECMELLKEFDPFLQRYNTPSNATYLSPESQNDMIECCAQEITDTIVSEMSKSGMYAIMADEARDGQSEQLALCVRYVTEGTVKERLLALAEIKSFDAQSIENELQQQLQMRGVAGLKCVAQTYDGAAGLHKFLQKETVDLAEACFGKQAVRDTLIVKRTDAFATELYDRTKALCEIHNIPEADAARKRKQSKMGDFVVETSLGLDTELSCSQTLKTELLLPCLDRMVCELDQRFSTVDAGLLKDIQVCSPNSKNFLDTSCLTEFAKHYGIDVKTEEMLVARNFLARKREAGCPPKDMLAVHNLLDDDMFPSLKEIIQVALTIPVSSCSCERSFSALCRLHSWLRKTMGQKRLASLAAMSIEGEVLGPLSHNSVIDRFATFKNRRYTLMCPPTK
ncbi:zinc finger MYM-type protein 1-like, partial [Acipenser oxyrinchus oxyrinchus]